jgi:hypothetical protein
MLVTAQEARPDVESACEKDPLFPQVNLENNVWNYNTE